MNRSSSNVIGGSGLTSPRRGTMKHLRLSMVDVLQTDDDVVDGGSNHNKVEHSNNFGSPVRRSQAFSGTVTRPAKNGACLLQNRKPKKGFNMKPVISAQPEALEQDETTTEVKRAEERSDQVAPVMKGAGQGKSLSHTEHHASTSAPGWKRVGSSRRASMGAVPAANEEGDFDEAFLNNNSSFVSHGGSFDCGTSGSNGIASNEDDSTHTHGSASESEIDEDEEEKGNGDEIMASFDDIAQRSRFDEIAQRKKTKGNGVILPCKHDTPTLRVKPSTDAVVTKEDDVPEVVAPISPMRRPFRTASSLIDIGLSTSRVSTMPANLTQSPRRVVTRKGSLAERLPPCSPQAQLSDHDATCNITKAESNGISRGDLNSERPRAPRRTVSMGNSKRNNLQLQRRSARTLPKNASCNGGEKNIIQIEVNIPFCDDAEVQNEASAIDFDDMDLLPPQSPRRVKSQSTADFDQSTPRIRNQLRRFSSDGASDFQHHSPSPRRLNRRPSPVRTMTPRLLTSLAIPAPNDPQTPVLTKQSSRRKVSMIPVRRASNESTPHRSLQHRQPRTPTQSASVGSFSSSKKEIALHHSQSSPRQRCRSGRMITEIPQQSLDSSIGCQNSSKLSRRVCEHAVPTTPELSCKEWDNHSLDREQLTVPFSPVKKSGGRLNLHRDGSTAPTTDDETVFSEPDFVVETQANHPILYKYAKKCEWANVAIECSLNPRDAKYVDPENGTTALHLAVMSRAQISVGSNMQPAPLSVLKLLIIACPEAAIIRCLAKRYTPLSYACFVTDDYDFKDAAEMVRTIVRHAPHSALVFTDDGYSALDVHIISNSRLQQQHPILHSGQPSTRVLRALLGEHPSLVQPRLYGTRMRGPVELLYRCNIAAFKAASSEDRCHRKQHHEWWAFQWTLELLEASWSFHRAAVVRADSVDVGGDSFSAMHAAAQIVACPGPILQLVLDDSLIEATMRSNVQRKFNSPLHEVCGWATDDWIFEGDPFILKRKRNAIGYLLDVFPQASRMVNNLGETPLQLAVETCTPWDQGLAPLVKAYGRALLIPRSIENCPDDGPLAKAMAFHADDLGSVGCDEDEWGENPMAAIDGMYPFLVAAVLACVPDRKSRSAPLHFEDKAARDKKQSAKSKDLESLRSIYGLLRARPDALLLYIQDEQTRREVESSSYDDEESNIVLSNTCGSNESDHDISSSEESLDIISEY